MPLFLKVDPALMSRFPGLTAQIIRIRGVEVKREKPELEFFKAEVVKKIREKWTLEQLREHPVFRAYRDFFWRIGVDPTKTRPAADALIRRVLHGSPLPKINTLVDSYNMASIDTAIALAAFDEDKLAGDLMMRAAEAGEEFLGIGMEKAAVLGGGEVVITDGERLVAIYPHRDADYSKVTEGTRNVLMLVCGVPNIDEETLTRAGRVTVDYVTRFCDGSES
jgi:DNA/RNA-binding domain of Phe-tRNA-synthetase-like protein